MDSSDHTDALFEGSKRIIYDSGLPFSRTCLKSLNNVNNRIAQKKASLVIVDGGVGEGKTTLMVHLADYINGKPIDMDKQYAIGGAQFQERLQICVDSSLNVIIYDEAGDFNKRGALTAFNALLNRIFETYRQFKIVVILGLPDFCVLDDNLFRIKVPRLLFHCHSRTMSQGNFKGYSLLRMFWLRHHAKKLVVPPQAFSKVYPNFNGHFLDLPAARSKELERISGEGKAKIISEAVLKSQGMVPVREIARQLQRSTRWVKAAIVRRKIKHQKFYMRAKYYDRAVVDDLREELRYK